MVITKGSVWQYERVCFSLPTLSWPSGQRRKCSAHAWSDEYQKYRTTASSPWVLTFQRQRWVPPPWQNHNPYSCLHSDCTCLVHHEDTKLCQFTLCPDIHKTSDAAKQTADQFSSHLLTLYGDMAWLWLTHSVCVVQWETSISALNPEAAWKLWLILIQWEIIHGSQACEQR